MSNDKFGKVIEKYLKGMCSEVYLIEDLKSQANRRYLDNIDALIVADYTDEIIIGNTNAQISAQQLIDYSRKISVIQFAGDIDVDELDKYDIPYFPGKRTGKYRMGMSLAHLGPKPVIDLHCAGLKVGEIMARARLNGKTVEETKMMALKYSPAQIIN